MSGIRENELGFERSRPKKAMDFVKFATSKFVAIGSAIDNYILNLGKHLAFIVVLSAMLLPALLMRSSLDESFRCVLIVFGQSQQSCLTIVQWYMTTANVVEDDLSVLTELTPLVFATALVAFRPAQLKILFTLIAATICLAGYVLYLDADRLIRIQSQGFDDIVLSMASLSPVYDSVELLNAENSVVKLFGSLRTFFGTVLFLLFGAQVRNSEK